MNSDNKEIKISDVIDIPETAIKESEMKLGKIDFPILIQYEGRVHYRLDVTSNDRLILTKKD